MKYPDLIDQCSEIRIPMSTINECSSSQSERSEVHKRPKVPNYLDFDSDGDFDAADIDALTTAIRDGVTSARFDLNNDGIVNTADRTGWVVDVKQTWFGDANLDGEFNSGDFVQVFSAGEYEDAVDGNSTWATGDWNGDGDFNSGDFVVAFGDGGFEIGPRNAVSSVPEPSGLGLVLAAMMTISFAVRRNRANS